MGYFDGKVVIITGAARGLGFDYAKFFLEDGAHVVLGDINCAAVQEAALSLRASGRTLGICLDVTDEVSTQAMAQHVMKTFGHADILVNNAAIWGDLLRSPLLETDSQYWDKVMNTNVKGALLCCRALVPIMRQRGWGRIINIGSVRIRKMACRSDRLRGILIKNNNSLEKECFMNCPHCTSTTTKKQTQRTTLGYCTFRCSTCKHLFNERTGTPFNFLEYPTDVVLLVVLWRLRYKLSLRDLAEMFLERGLVFSHETVREWEARFAPFIAEKLRARRHGHAGTSWHIDETYIKVHGKWCYLYRAIDHDGNLVDSMLSEKRNMEAAQRFFKQAVAVVGHIPESVTTDGHRSYPRAIRETMGNHVQHRTNKYLNNRLEQDHRGIKQRYYPMRGFETFEAAARFCCAFDELRNYLRLYPIMGETISLSERRRAFIDRLVALQVLLQAAS